MIDRENYLSIGEMARLLGTTKDTLYFYERRGILTPALVRENGYRYYDRQNYYTMDMVLTMRKAQAPVEEIEAWWRNGEPLRNLDMMERRTAYLSGLIREYEVLVGQLTDAAAQVREGLQSPGPYRARLEELAEATLLVVPMEDQNRFRQVAKAMRGITEAGEAADLPYGFHFSAMVSEERLRERIFDADYLYTIVPAEGLKEAAPAPKVTAPMIRRRAGRYAVLIHAGAYDDLPKTYERLFAYMKRKGLAWSGPAFEQTLIGWHSCKKEEDLRTKVMIRVS